MTETPPGTATDAGEAADPSPAPVALFAYLPGFEAGVQAGYQVGRRDLEREKSEAAADGFRRGRRAAEAFALTPEERKSAVRSGLFAGAVIGLIFGAFLEQRRHPETVEIEEVGADELPDVRD